MQGYANGTFSDIEMLVGMAVGFNGESDCLTRLQDCVFHLSKQMTNTIESATVQDKLLRLISSIYSLFLNLMLDLDQRHLQGSF